MQTNKQSFFVVGLGAGTFKDKEENKSIDYANMMILADKDTQIIEHQNINIGQELAKVQLSSDDNNALSLALANSGLIPGYIVFHTKSIIKKGISTIKIVGFDDKKATA